MATLELLNHVYEGTVSQTNTITVLGESSSALSGEEITVHVPLSKFKKVLQYSSNWNPDFVVGDAGASQELPKVWFKPSEATSELEAMYSSLSDIDEGVAGDRVWVDSANNTHDKFGKILLEQLTFTNSALDDNELPREAIRKIEEGDIVAPGIMTTVTNQSHDGKGDNGLTSLFEQAVSAGRVLTTDAAGNETNSKCPSFAVNDTISFNVKYTFNKQREYVLDGTVGETDATADTLKSITIGGNVIEITADNEEATYERTYVITLKAVADA